jgi:predicted nuclease of restriction endonuclease-like (RecB) superfamily
MELENLKEYKEWLKELKERLLKAQIKASVVVNKELHNFYWELGADIVEKQEKALWGSSFLNKLSKDLSEEFPNMKGFSSRNLNYIKKWYQFWNRAEILQRPVAEIKDAIFSIPWGQNIEIITKVKSHEEAFFYAQGTLEYNWSRPVLVHQIESKLYERKGKAINNFQNLLPATHSDLARDITKDPYNFDFLTLTANYNERELETGLVNHITKFLGEKDIIPLYNQDGSFNITEFTTIISRLNEYYDQHNPTSKLN